MIITIFLQAIVAALFMNIYIVGLNQLSDIEIDKVFFYLLNMDLISECRTMHASLYLCEGLVEDSSFMFCSVVLSLGLESEQTWVGYGSAECLLVGIGG